MCLDHTNVQIIILYVLRTNSMIPMDHKNNTFLPDKNLICDQACKPGISAHVQKKAHFLGFVYDKQLLETFD